MTPIADSGSDAGATNTPNPGPSATDRESALRNDLSGSAVWEQVEALAAILEPEAFDSDQAADGRWREATKFIALNHAAKVITSGYRRVSEDDATIDRVAEALHARNCDCTAWSDEDLAAARAAVRALREETA